MSPEAWSAVAAIFSAAIALFAALVARSAYRVAKGQLAAADKAAIAAEKAVEVSNKTVEAAKEQVKVGELQAEAARQQLRATAWDLIVQFDATLREYRNEREWVNAQAKIKPLAKQEQNKKAGDDHDIAGYMGIFERLSKFMEIGPDFVPEETAHAFYGPRIRKLLKTARARNTLKDNRESWVLFIILALKLDSYAHRSKRNPVIAEPGPESESGPDETFRKELEAYLCEFADKGDERAKELLADLMAERADLDGLRAKADCDNREAASRQA